MLTTDQIESCKLDGHVMIEDTFMPEQLATRRGITEDLIERLFLPWTHFGEIAGGPH
jgi:hypothetical protein